MASSTEYVGWGRAGWGQASYGLDWTVVSVDGSAGTGAVGNETVVAKAVVSVTGVSASTALGAEIVIAKAVVPVTGSRVLLR